MSFKGIFSRKSNNVDNQNNRNSETETDENTDTESEQHDSNLPTEELPEESCRLCYEHFKMGNEAYKCPNCETIYHHPKCLKNQTSCRVCGEKITEEDNIVILIKTKFVRCPKCKKKMKLDYSVDTKIHVNCQNCGSEGKIPNPYLEDIDTSQKGGDKPGLPDKIEINMGTEDKDDSESTEIIKPSDVEPRKPKLVILEESITCHVCLGTIKTGLPVVVCKCGKKYHESCANRVGSCPICEAELTDYEPVSEEAKERSDKFKKPMTTTGEIIEDKQELDTEPEQPEEPIPESIPEPEPEPAVADTPEPESEPESEPEPEPDIENELDPNNTFDNFIIDDHNRIVHSIAKGIAQAPGNEFNVFYMYGPKGLGKTHLLQAIGNHIENSETNFKVKYADFNSFLAELDQAHDSGKQKEYVTNFNETDVFLLDNISDVSIDKGNQKVVNKLLKSLLQKNKQIVITGNRPVDAIKSIEKNLSNMVRDGLNIKLNQPGSDFRKKILKKHVSKLSVEMLEELIESSSGKDDDDISDLKKEIGKILKSNKKRK